MEMTKRSVGRGRALCAVMLAAILLAMGGWTESAHAETTNDTVMVKTQRMSSSTLKSTQKGWWSKGSHLRLVCYERGQSVSGYYSRYVKGGRSNIWYRASDGYWIADIDLSTGSNNPVTPTCSSLTSAKTAYGRKIGAKRTWNAGVAGNCTWGAYEKWRAATGYYPALSGNAKDWATSAKKQGWSVVADAQAKSIVVFQPGVQGAGGYGHVGWVTSTQKRKDGVYITITEMNYAGGLGKWHTRTVKDVPGMSYILAPVKH